MRSLVIDCDHNDAAAYDILSARVAKHLNDLRRVFAQRVGALNAVAWQSDSE